MLNDERLVNVQFTCSNVLFQIFMEIVVFDYGESYRATMKVFKTCNEEGYGNDEVCKVDRFKYLGSVLQKKLGF